MASQFAEFNNGVTFEQAVHLVRQEINANYEVILRDLAPQEVFVQYQAEGFGRDAEDFNLLFYAIKAKNRNAIVIVMEKMLTLHGPTSFHWANSKGTTALHLAVKERNLDLVRELLELEVDPSPRMRKDGWTPLHTAANRRQNLEMIQLLVQYRADVNAVVAGSGWTPLHGAVMEKDAASVEFLIKNSANLNLVASKRDVSKGAKLTPRELAAATQFEPMSVFDGTQAQQPAINSYNTDLPSTEAELEAMIQERIDKALAAKLTELMKAEKKEEEGTAVPKAEKMKSKEDVEVEAAMERMRRDEALERGESR